MIKHLSGFIFLSLLICSSAFAQTPTKTSTKAADPAAMTTDAAANPAAQEKEEKGREWRLGPAISFGFPHFTEYSLEYTANDIFSAALLFGGLSVKPDDKNQVKLSNYEIRGRWHPFSGTFFLGLGLGNQNIKITTTDTISGSPVAVSLDVKGMYLLPHLGWLSVSKIGFTYGFDIGYLSPSSVTSTFTSDASNAVQATAEYQNLKKDAESTGDKFGRTALPYITLFKLGWLF